MGRPTALVVHYDPKQLMSLSKVLESEGLEVHTCADGEAALVSFAKVRPDIVILEAMIPRRNGFEVCRQLKSTVEGKRTPIVITSGVYSSFRHRSEALHTYGCQEFLGRGFSSRDLARAVGRLLPALHAAGGNGGLDADEIRPGPTPLGTQEDRTAGENGAAEEGIGELAESEISELLDSLFPTSGTDTPARQVENREEPSAAAASSAAGESGMEAGEPEWLAATSHQEEGASLVATAGRGVMATHAAAAPMRASGSAVLASRSAQATTATAVLDPPGDQVESAESSLPRTIASDEKLQTGARPVEVMDFPPSPMPLGEKPGGHTSASGTARGSKGGGKPATGRESIAWDLPSRGHVEPEELETIPLAPRNRPNLDPRAIPGIGPVPAQNRTVPLASEPVRSHRGGRTDAFTPVFSTPARRSRTGLWFVLLLGVGGAALVGYYWLSRPYSARRAPGSRPATIAPARPSGAPPRRDATGGASGTQPAADTATASAAIAAPALPAVEPVHPLAQKAEVSPETGATPAARTAQRTRRLPEHAAGVTNHESGGAPKEARSPAAPPPASAHAETSTAPGAGEITSPEPAAQVPPPATAAPAAPDAPPLATWRPAPERPEGASVGDAAAAEVVVRVLVSPVGTPKEVRLVRSDSALHAMSAMQAVRNWRYDPAKRNGLPVEEWVTEVVSFRTPRH